MLKETVLLDQTSAHSSDPLTRMLDHLTACRDHVMMQIKNDEMFRWIPSSGSDSSHLIVTTAIKRFPQINAVRNYSLMLVDMLYPHEDVSTASDAGTVVVINPAESIIIKLVSINSPFLMMVCYTMWQASFHNSFRAEHIELFDSIF